MRLHSVSGKTFVTALSSSAMYSRARSILLSLCRCMCACMWLSLEGTCLCHAHKHVYNVDETWIYCSCACTKHSSKIDYLGFVVTTSWHSILLLVSASCTCIQTVNKQGLFSKLKFQPLGCAK